MGQTNRFTVEIDSQLYDRLKRETEERKPRLPKRYVVELALTELFRAVDQGQLELGLDGNG